MKNKKDVFALKQKSKEIYEKLSMLAFVEEYVNTTPNLKESKEELIEKVAQGFVSKDISIFEEVTSNEVVEDGEKIVYDLADTPKEESEIEEILEQPFDELEEIIFSENETEHINEVINIEVNKTKSLEEELQDIISVDVMADLFENAQPKSLNDKLVNNIQIGLNDRIIFVKNLFNNQQEDYNRVISQLNTFKSEKEAKQFINKMIKPDYNWSEHEELENRFLEIIERKFA
ncbi:hypothetical protein [Polaribacter sp. Hel1_33_78]|uniref:hypothetical protein n=1 Tax=Polaribacter sp. Hel1_33_78 TaxID=1336804 RepID=UPI001E2F5FA2|nr:hypothetical protein [Polaribacter sp. Hel1_33_78]